jgi:hypothetical protein
MGFALGDKSPPPRPALVCYRAYAGNSNRSFPLAFGIPCFASGERRLSTYKSYRSCHEPSRGWLTIYHEVRNTASGSIYRMGLALFDLEDPAVCLHWQRAASAACSRGLMRMPVGAVQQACSLARKEGTMSSANWSWLNPLPQLLWRRHECPRCASVHFKPAEQRSFDGLLSMLALRPVRCTFCWRRYYWFAFHPPNSA